MKVFTTQYFEDLIGAASQSPRLRAHANVHNSYNDKCQKLFNAIQINSYIRPHRHSLDPKEECLVAISGLFALIEFNDHGDIKSILLFGSENYSQKFKIASGIEVNAFTWHTVVALVDKSIIFEVKTGPFDLQSAKEFAPWSPEEGSQESLSYHKTLLDLARGQL